MSPALPAEPQRIAGRAFSMEDQAWFASLTHDRNPMHVDRLAARRTQYGVPVVHGIHIVLWALDAFLAARTGLRPAGLDVRFTKPVLVGDAVSLVAAPAKPGDASLQVFVGDVLSASLRLTGSTPRGIPEEGPRGDVRDPQPPRSSARELPLEDLPGWSGACRYDGEAAAAAFPAAAAALGAGAVGGLAAATYVVGMECPGLHSIFGSLAAVFRGHGQDGVARFAVRTFDPRFRSVDVGLWTAGITAALGAFARVPPVLQPGMAELAELVRPGEFRGQRALVVGGSRGIGEVAAKLLAAGGAQVVLTYAVGEADAARIVDGIRAAGGDARAVRYDVRQPADRQLGELDFAPNAMHYFATSAVFRRKLALYEPELMREFLTFYLDGFYDLSTALQQRTKGDLVVFYPSTVAAEAPVRGLAEYAASKIAGEVVCSHLNAFSKGIEVVTLRIPRTNTDQTATLSSAAAASAADVVLPALRDVQGKLRPAVGQRAAPD